MFLFNTLQNLTLFQALRNPVTPSLAKGPEVLAGGTCVALPSFSTEEDTRLSGVTAFPMSTFGMDRQCSHLLSIPTVFFDKLSEYQ